MSDFVQVKRHILTNTGYKLLSQWVSSNSVEFDDGTDLESNIEAFKSDSNLKSNSSLTLAKDTNNEVTISATQLSQLLALLNLTTWNGGSY